MILKILDYRKGENENVLYDEWNYFDNIESASNYFDEASKMTVVRCNFKDGNRVTFAIRYIAYLMSDTGKTIDKIEGAPCDAEGDTEGRYSTLQEAAAVAMAE